MPRMKKFADLHSFLSKKTSIPRCARNGKLFFFEKEIVGRKFFHARQNISTLQEYIFLIWWKKKLRSVTVITVSKMKAAIDRRLHKYIVRLIPLTKRDSELASHIYYVKNWDTKLVCALYTPSILEILRGQKVGEKRQMACSSPRWGQWNAILHLKILGAVLEKIRDDYFLFFLLDICTEISHCYCH